MLLGLGRAGQVPPDPVDGGPHRLDLAAQALALCAALLGLALEPFAFLAHLVGAAAAGLLELLA